MVFDREPRHDTQHHASANGVLLVQGTKGMSQDLGIIPDVASPPEWTPAHIGNAMVRGGEHEQTNLGGRSDSGGVFEEKSADLASFAVRAMKPELIEVAVTELGDVLVPCRLADGVDLDRIARLHELFHKARGRPAWHFRPE